MEKYKQVRNFTLGLLTGVGIGILFAPKSGAETRNELKLKFNDLVEYVKDLDSEDIKNMMNKKITEIKKAIDEFDMAKSVETAKKKSKEILKKLDELKDMAVEKATPYVESAVESLRLKTIDVLNCAIDKLETK